MAGDDPLIYQYVLDSNIKHETINHPSHYNKGKYEVIDVIEDWNLGFHLGNAVKYIARAEHKDNIEKDIRKAIWYLKRKLQDKDVTEKHRPGQG